MSIIFPVLLELLWVDAKSTTSYSSDLHFSVFQNRPHRGALICSKICSKKLQTKKKGMKWHMSDKKSLTMMPYA